MSELVPQSYVSQMKRLGLILAGLSLVVLIGFILADRAAHDDAHGEGDHAAQVDGEHAADGAHGEGEAHDDHGGHGTPVVHPIWITPFALLLGSIALGPLLAPGFWHHHYPKVSIGLGLITAIYYVFIFDDPHAIGAWLHEMKEYVSFIALLASLYIVSGGIVINVQRKGTPLANTAILAVGAVIANVVGTTGAAMLLIRPFIRINRAHIRPFHIVFFIFLCANCGGALTPIGDPPLFMGFLKGVPFFWVLKACWPLWIAVCGIMLVIFFVLDTLHSRTTQREAPAEGNDFSITGKHNFVWILLILVGVFQSSVFAIESWYQFFYCREFLQVLAIVCSKAMTNIEIYRRNEFDYEPIREVALIFIGIFSTMVPALNYLNLNSETLPLKTPGQYYMVTGGLSAVLDNAPTYLVFLETKQGSLATDYPEEIGRVRSLLEEKPTSVPEGEGEFVTGTFEALKKFNRKKVLENTVTDTDIRIAGIIGTRELEMYLIAISMGAVFFGAMTYIGNGPNFMVKSIAESAGIEMPSFFGYVIKYSIPFLLPVVVAVWYAFSWWHG